jgi:hypothetical protein
LLRWTLSAFGTKRTCQSLSAMSASGGKADIAGHSTREHTAAVSSSIGRISALFERQLDSRPVTSDGGRTISNVPRAAGGATAITEYRCARRLSDTAAVQRRMAANRHLRLATWPISSLTASRVTTAEGSGASFISDVHLTKAQGLHKCATYRTSSVQIFAHVGPR